MKHLSKPALDARAASTVTRRKQPLAHSLIRDPLHEPYIRELVQPLANLRISYSVDEFRATVLLRRPDAVIVSLRDNDPEHPIAALAAIWNALATVPRAVYVGLTPLSPHIVLEAGRYGFEYLFVHNHPADRRVLQRVLEHARSHALLTALDADLRTVSSEYVQQFCRQCFAHACELRAVEEAVTSMRVSRQHVARAFAANHLPPPGWYLTMARIATAVRLLEDRSISVERAAQAVRFASSASLRKAVLRHAHVPFSQVHTCDGFNQIVEIIRKSFVDHGPDDSALTVSLLSHVA